MATTDFALSVQLEDVWRELAAAEMDLQKKAVHILDLVGREAIAFLRSTTSELRPPVRKGEGPRQAHPGGWADITGNLANAYRHEVQLTDEGVRLALLNDMEYAVYLEARDGYYVLSGITDRGGPVEQALRDVIGKHFPEFELRVA